MMNRDLYFIIPGFDDWIIRYSGVIFASFTLVVITSGIVWNWGRLPTLACIALACLPGFVLQFVAAIYLFNPSMDLLFNAEMISGYLHRDGYLINWVPFYVFLGAVVLMILRIALLHLPNSARWQTINLLSLNVLCGVIVLDGFQHNWRPFGSLTGPVFYTLIGSAYGSFIAIIARKPNETPRVLTVLLLTVIVLSYPATFSRIVYMNGAFLSYKGYGNG